MRLSRHRKWVVKPILLVTVSIWAMIILHISFNGYMGDTYAEWNRAIDLQTEGYIRARRLQKLCNKRGYEYSSGFNMTRLKYSTTDGSIQLCPIWKAGSTFIKRLFMMKTLKRFENVTNPYRISFLEEFEGSNSDVHRPVKVNAKRFVFVRNPYDRLFSGYVDKILAPNPVYWKLIGIPAIKYGRSNPSKKSLTCGHDLTFKEYVKYVIFALESSPALGSHRKRRRVGVGHDLHFAPLTEISKPCSVKYDFIGKMETFASDALELIRQLNLSETEKILKLDGSEMAADDAIQDTLYQPFDGDFRSQFLRCITMKEALDRSWQKLQIRGLIGDQKLDMSDNGAEQLTYAEFLQKARTARNSAPKERRSKLKKAFFNEFYATISQQMFQKLSSIYKDDFQLFEYDDRPNY